MVRHPAQAAAVATRALRRSALAALAALAAVAASLALAACGGEGGGPAAAQGGPAINRPVELADCTDWKQASVEERLGTIDQIETFAGGPTSLEGTRGPVLDDEQAYELMESFCGETYARGFRLYKIYLRAAGFSGH